MHFITRNRLLIMTLFTLASCHASPEKVTFMKEAPHYFYSELNGISQNALDYFPSTLLKHKQLITQQNQEKLVQNFLQRYFSPWRGRDHFASSESIKQQQQATLEKFLKQPVWGANHYPIPLADIEAIEQNLDLAQFPNRQAKGITLQGVDLKQLPTSRLFFGKPGSPGEGYPFDNNEETWVNSNTPALILHETRDGAWRLVLLGNIFGWLPTPHVATVDEAFIQQWQHPKQGHVTINTLQCALLDQKSQFVTEAQLSSLHPRLAEQKEHWTLYAANSDAQGRAILQRVTVVKGADTRFPLPLTPFQIATQINQLMAVPYSWGGLNGSYDCSSTLVTLFQSFGIWLPRNSGDQARQAKQFIDLTGLTPEKKRGVIQQKGVPLLTLGWLPGHIVLYIGQQQDAPYLFNTLWGLKTVDPNTQQIGRSLIGRSVIMPLQIDAGYSNIPITLLDKLQRLILVTENNYPVSDQ